MTVAIVGWIATALILATYALVARRPQHMKVYNLVNCVTAPLFMLLAVQGHAYPNAALSGAFGLIALWALVWRR